MIAILILLAVAGILASILLTPVMGIRMIEGDEHYGYLGAGSMTMSAANAFSAGMLPTVIEPDFIVKAPTGDKISLRIDVKDVLVWDARAWHVMTSAIPDTTGGEDTAQTAQGGLTKDNTVQGNDQPEADSIAQGTRPGGNGAAIVGAAAGGPGTVMNGDEQPTRFVDRWMFFGNSDEEQTAVGQILHAFDQLYTKQNAPYQVEGNEAHYLMTAAHYHLWEVDNDLAVASTESIGFEVRRMSVDLKELMFDRAVILSILDALVVSS